MLRSVLGRVRAALDWWIADIRRRPSTIGKIGSLSVGLFLMCCVCSVGLAAVRSTGQAVGLVAPDTPTPIPAPTSAPAPTAPAAAAQPTTAPAAEPSATPTALPTQAPPTPRPTARPTTPPPPPPAARATTAPAKLIGVAPQGRACPAEHPIKGNVRQRDPDKGAKIYHVPGDNGYAQTIPEQCFATVADAEAAGYRAVQR